MYLFLKHQAETHSPIPSIIQSLAELISIGSGCRFFVYYIRLATICILTLFFAHNYKIEMRSFLSFFLEISPFSQVTTLNTLEMC